MNIRQAAYAEEISLSEDSSPFSFEQGWALFTELFNRTTEAVFVVTPQPGGGFQLLRGNRRFCAAFGSGSSLLPEHRLPGSGQFIRKLERCIQEQKPELFEINDHSTGRLYWNRLFPVSDARGRFILCMVNDITDSRKLEQEMIRVEKFKAQEWLASGLVHDFSNLLTGMLGNIFLLRREISELAGEDRTVSGRLDQLEDAVLRGRQLTGQISSFCRSGMRQDSNARLSEIVQQSAGFILNGAEAEFELVCDLPDEPEVPIGRCQLAQVIQNLLLNALQNSSGNCRINARIELIFINEQHNLPLTFGKHLVLSIADNGRGLSPSVMQHLFEPFFSTQEDGTGLGLAICFSVLHSANGHITAENRPEGGAEFKLYIPVSGL